MSEERLHGMQRQAGHTQHEMAPMSTYKSVRGPLLPKNCIRQMDGWMDGWIDGWMDAWMDGLMDG